MCRNGRFQSVISWAGWLCAGALNLAAGCGTDGADGVDDQSPELAITSIAELSGRTPVLSTISPSMGPDTGLGGLTITGKNFRAGTTVTVGGLAASYVSIASTTSLSAQVPANSGAFGPVAVRITNPDGRYVERSDLFSYYSDKVAWSSPGRQTLSVTPLASAAGDFNKDGRQDLVILKDYSGIMQVLLGTANGDYTLGSEFTVGIPGFGAASVPLFARDFDGDGNLDIIALPVYTDGAVLLGKGDGTFAAAVTKYNGAGMIAWGNLTEVGELIAGADANPELLIGTGYSGSLYIGVANPPTMPPGPLASLDCGLASLRQVHIADVKEN